MGFSFDWTNYGLLCSSCRTGSFVLKEQVEEVTEGSISAKAMGLGLSLGVGVSVALSMIRVITGISILYFVIPGYLIALILTFIVPPYLHLLPLIPVP